MPVLFVSYTGQLGGAERLLVDLAEGLEGERCLACPPGPLAAAARDAGLRVFELRRRRLEMRGSARDLAATPLRIAAHAAEVRRLDRALHPRLVVAWSMRSALAAALAVGGDGPRRLVFHHNDFLPGPVVAGAARAAARRCARVIAVSAATARDLDPRGGLTDRLRVAHPGVDLERLRPEPLPPGPPEVLVLGALVGWKRPDLALDAFAAAAASLPDLRLRLAGRPLGSAGARVLSGLLERVRREGLEARVEIAGEVEAAGALGRASCLLHCAEREPFGLVVAEALAAGRPVVVPDAGGPAEIADAGVGRVYRAGDAASAGAALVELLGEPGLAARLGAQGRRRAEARLGLDSARRRWRAALPPGRPSPPGDGEGTALVTVTHDSAGQLTALLRSVERHLPAARVVVVDSGSRDESVAVARAWGGGAEVIELGANLGFGAGCNRGVEAVREAATVLVNPDVELLDASLATLAAEALRTDRPERLLAPLVLLPTGGRQDSAHPVPGSPADLLRVAAPPRALPAPLRLRVEPWRSDRPRRAGWAVGCCLAARTETLRRLGPFDARDFLYAEDLDLGLRAGAAGVETWFWPSARVLHHRAHSSARAFAGEPYDLLARRRQEVVARRLGPGRARLDRAAQVATFAIRGAVRTLAGRPAAREWRRLAAARRAGSA